jgi:methyl coenzyme M reductase subunit C
MFPPNYVVDVGEGEEVAAKCVFCHTDKKEVTVVFEEEGNREEKITKKDCIKKYALFLKKLHESKRVQDIINADSPSVKG